MARVETLHQNLLKENKNTNIVVVTGPNYSMAHVLDRTSLGSSLVTYSFNNCGGLSVKQNNQARYVISGESTNSALEVRSYSPNSLVLSITLTSSGVSI